MLHTHTHTHTHTFILNYLFYIYIYIYYSGFFSGFGSDIRRIGLFCHPYWQYYIISNKKILI